MSTNERWEKGVETAYFLNRAMAIDQYDWAQARQFYYDIVGLYPESETEIGRAALNFFFDSYIHLEKPSPLPKAALILKLADAVDQLISRDNYEAGMNPYETREHVSPAT